LAVLGERFPGSGRRALQDRAYQAIAAAALRGGSPDSRTVAAELGRFRDPRAIRLAATWLAQQRPMLASEAARELRRRRLAWLAERRAKPTSKRTKP
jgi:hypothetical protein